MKNFTLSLEFSIIVCHHRGDFIYKFVESVKKSVFGPYEIIVMTSDDALSTQGISDCRVFYHEGMPAAKRNAGARLAKCRYLGFFDDDVEIDPKCLVFLKAALSDPKVGMVYGKLHKADEPTRFDEAGGYLTSSGFIWSRAGQNIIDHGQFDIKETILAGKSASCMVYKPAFDAVGGFDEDFEILGEETDLSWRIWLSGGTVLFEPKAIGTHYFNTKFKPAQEYYTSKRVHYNGSRNYITMLIKNLGKEHLWIIPIHTLIWFFAGCAMLITGKISQGMNILKGLWYVISNRKLILEKRKRIQEKRYVDESTLWPIISRRAPRGYYAERFTRYCRIGLHG